MHYAIIDVETTGGRSAVDRITEVAIYRFDGEQIVDEYQSLVDPEINIPPYITELTGIDDDMVAGAPTFLQIADEIEAITKDAAFVAHNAHFDYSFIKKEFNRIDRKFQRKKLCTVRLSRKIMPGHKSYSLGKLTARLGIEITDRHRAFGDARATVEVLRQLIAADKDDFIGHSLNRNSGEANLPPHLNKEVFENLPEETGVYFFHDEGGKIIYIGKAKNIKSRVHSHFSANTNTSSKHRFLDHVHDVSYEVTGGEMMAELTEAQAIKKHWPQFNRSLKRISLNHGIFAYFDRNGYGRFSLAKTSKTNPALLSFKTEPEAFYRLKNLTAEFELCPRLAGVQYTEEACHNVADGSCQGACTKAEDTESYNLRYKSALEDLKGTNLTYLLQSKGREEEEAGMVLVERGRYKGFGYVPRDVQVRDIDDVRDYIQTGYDDQDMQYIIRSWEEKRGVTKIIL